MLIKIGCLVSNLTTTTTTSTTTTTMLPIAPVAIASATAFCGCSNISISLTNVTYSPAYASYQWQSSPAGQNNWSNIIGITTNPTLTITAQNNSTDYRCRVLLTSPSMNLTSNVVTIITPSGYCTINTVNCSYGDTINDFIFNGEMSTQINDIGTGCAPNSYDNRTQQSVWLFENRVYTLYVSSQYLSGVRFSLWIDFNDNRRFESWERVAYQLLSGTSLISATVVIPSISSGATVGMHRMRAVVTWNVNPDPCGTSGIFGEVHDYRVNISAYIGKRLTRV